MLTKKLSVVLAAVLIGAAAVFAWNSGIPQAAAQIAAAPASPQELDTVSSLAPHSQIKVSGGDFTISRLNNDQFNAAIAYNSTDDEYLVVWVDSQSYASYVLMGQVYSAQGSPQDDLFPISDSTTDSNPAFPRVAYNPNRQEYLVIWSNVTSTTSEDIYGQRVSTAGALLGGGNFPISTAAGEQFYPRLAHNPISDDYLVVWVDTRNYASTKSDIYGQRVDGDGVLLGNSNPAINFPIAASNIDEYAPELAYNTDLDEFMVILTGKSTTSIEIMGQRVDADGAQIGSLLNISNSPESENLPHILYHPLRHRYLLAWQTNASNYNMNLYVQWMTGGGVLEDTPMRLSETAGMYPYSLCLDTASGQALIAWGDLRNSSNNVQNIDIYAARVLKNGELATQGAFAISTQASQQRYPAVGCSSASHQFIVVYEDNRDTRHYKLYGQRVWWPGMLLGAEFSVGVPDLEVDYPAIAFDERENRYLVVWADDRNGNGDIFGQLFDRHGLPIEENFTIYQGAGVQGLPDVAYNSASSSYLVVWQDSQTHRVGGQLVSAQGSLTYSPLTISSLVVTSTRPTVAANSNPAYANFLVVFEQDAGVSTGKDLEARLVNANGTQASYGVPVSSATGSQGIPDLVYNSTNNEFLVVWSDNRSGIYQTYGQRIGPSYQMQGANFAISTGVTVMEQGAAIAYNPDDNQYLVAWHKDTPLLGEDIYAQRLAADGSMQGTNFQVSTAAGDNSQMFPTVIYFSALHRYGVLWGDNRDPVTQWDLRGQWVSNTGVVLGLFDLPIFRDVGVQSYPAIAYAPGYNQALTVWYNDTPTDIHSIQGRFGALDVTPPTARFTVDDSFGFSGQTFAFNAWPSNDDLTPRSLLMVRWDLNSDGVWDIGLGHEKYITRTIVAPGIYTITLEAWDMAWLTSTVKHRVAVFATPIETASGIYQPAISVPSLSVTPTLAAAGSTFKFDGQASSGMGTLLARWDFDNDGEFETDFSTTLTASHVYTQAGDYTARMELRDSDLASRSALVNLTVRPSILTGVEVSPSQLSVIPGEVVRLRTTAWDSFGNEVFNPSGITWSMLSPTAGTIDASGIYTASLQVNYYPNAIQANLSELLDVLSVKIYWPFQIDLPLIFKKY